MQFITFYCSATIKLNGCLNKLLNKDVILVAVFKLIPDNEGYNINDGIFGLNVAFDPIIDKCE